MDSGVDSGEKIGKYTKGRQLGRGGTGTVYLAKSDDSDQLLALKIVGSRRASAYGFLRRGAEAAKKLNHSGIAKTFDYGRQGDLYFVVGEYVDGKDLAQIFAMVAATTTVEFAFEDLWTEAGGEAGNNNLEVTADVDESPEGSPGLAAATDAKRGSSRPGTKLIQSKQYMQFCCRLAIDSLSALEYAHEQKVIHHDIKPGNLMMTRNGEVKIVDFGAARYEGDASLSGTGQVMGTPMYMSPEQANGKTPIDAKSDIFSLGAVLFEALTLTPPHRAGTIPGILRHAANRQIRPVGWENSKVPAHLQRIVHKATALSPDKRYRSAKAFAEDLQRFLDDRPVLAPAIRYVSDAHEIAVERPQRVSFAAMFYFFQALIVFMVLPTLIFAPQAAQFLNGLHIKIIALTIFATLIGILLSIGNGIMSARIIALLGSAILSMMGIIYFLYSLILTLNITEYDYILIFLHFFFMATHAFVLYAVCSPKTWSWVKSAINIRKDYQRPFFRNFI